MTLYQPEPVEISTRVRPGEWTEDSLAALVANFRQELLGMGAPPEEITVATDRDDRGGVSVVALWTRQPGHGTETIRDPDGAAANPMPDKGTDPAVAVQDPPTGSQGNTIMLNREDIDGLIQSKGNVVGGDGETIGGIGQIYVDDATDRPSWATASTGLFGTHESFFPLEGARVEGSNLVIPYSKALVKDAPRIEPEGELEPDEQDRLYRHYQGDGGLQTYSESRGLAGAGPGTDATPSTGPRNTGQSRLRRYLTTGERPHGAPVQGEDLPAGREPDSGTGPELPGAGNVSDEGSQP